MKPVSPSVGDALSPEEAMAYAIQIAYLGRGRVSPNPMVGCVIVDSEHQFVGAGYHQQVGQAHAEVNAVESVAEKEQLEGATVYVTLEPCAHQGRTPSCAEMLSRLPIKKVVYGMVDPFEKVSGQGLEKLERAGIQTEKFPGLEEPIQNLLEIFYKNQVSKQLFVAVKIATSLDGRYATFSNQSKWITGSESREKSHLLRATYDGIVVGSATLLLDDPRLNVRFPGLKDIQPYVIVLDPSLKIAQADLKIFDLHPPEKILVFHEQREFTGDARFEGVFLPRTGQSMDLQLVCERLYEKGLRSIFVEGGGKTISQFLNQSLADRLHLFIAPILMGAGKSWTDELQIENPLLNRMELRRLSAKKSGVDLYITGLIP